MTNTATVDVAIVGGGIAGLWLLNRMRANGFHAILLESKALGSGQTIQSQGIIHGGIKYALTGKLTSATQAIAEMPERWRQCLQGTGEIDLTAAHVLSNYQYLWSSGSLASNITTFLASKALRGKVNQIAMKDYPEIFQNERFKGKVYSLVEKVLDVNSLMTALAAHCQDAIFKVSSHRQMVQVKQSYIDHLLLKNEMDESVQLKARCYIFTAGEGNEALTQLFPSAPAMQRRPLHMTLVKPPVQQSLYAHCIGSKSTPRLTITSHRNSQNEILWYLGGQLAEEGVGKNQHQQVMSARRELGMLFPWIDWMQATWTTFMVNRAEPFHTAGQRPDHAFMRAFGNAIVAWPTKLALAPQLADSILKMLTRVPFSMGKPNLSALQHWERAQVAQPVWESLCFKKYS